MLTESKVKRANSGLLTTRSNGTASTTFQGLDGVLIGVAVLLGTATGATLSMVDDKGITLWSQAIVASGYFVPGDTLTDGTTPASVPLPLYSGATYTLNITSGGSVKTLTVFPYYR